jgi:hypothetical protein
MTVSDFVPRSILDRERHSKNSAAVIIVGNLVRSLIIICKFWAVGSDYQFRSEEM